MVKKSRKNNNLKKSGAPKTYRKSIFQNLVRLKPPYIFSYRA